MAVFTTIQSIPFLRSTFNCSINFHTILSPSSIVCPYIPSTKIMASFSATVNGHLVNALFDCQSSVTLSSSFDRLIKYRRQQNGIPIVVTTTAGAFSCFVNLLPDPVDTTYDLKLGRDRFSYNLGSRFRMTWRLFFLYLPFLQCALDKQVSFLCYNLILYCLILSRNYSISCIGRSGNV